MNQQKNKDLPRLDYAAAFIESQRRHRAQIRDQSQATNKNLIEAHRLALSAVISYRQRIQGIPYDALDDSIRQRSFLVAQFLQGTEITESAISDGLYAVAANLLKQELETIVAIDEIQAGRRRDGRTPNMQNAQNKLKHMYDELNDVAHPSKSDIVELVSSRSGEETYGPSQIPQFRRELYEWLYGRHALLLLYLLYRMKPLFLEVFEVDLNEEEESFAKSALRHLEKEGITQKRNTSSE